MRAGVCKKKKHMPVQPHPVEARVVVREADTVAAVAGVANRRWEQKPVDEIKQRRRPLRRLGRILAVDTVVKGAVAEGAVTVTETRSNEGQGINDRL